MSLVQKKKWLVIVVAIIICALAGVGVYALVVADQHAKAPVVAATKPQPQQTTISYTAKAGMTALAQLKQVASVVTKTSSYGEYVDSIGGLKGGTDGKYWSFYIDGSLATEGAGAYTSKGGEKIEWKFEKMQ